jgi:GPH family glycoside/pentoside/hexuronide:cation symporter
MAIYSTPDAPSSQKNLSRWIKIIYGSGDLGRASYNTLRQIFYAIFLTDVVGLDPRLASIAALVSIFWDAVNDPIIGSLSDNVQTRWGRRRPFLLLFSVPFMLAFLMLWWAPTWKSQWLLMLHVTLAYMASDTLQTLVTIPYLALTPELAPDYDERTSLTSIRMFFNLIASLVTAVAAPSILDIAVKNGFSLQQGYLTIAAIFGGIAVVPFILIFLVIREKPFEINYHSEQLTLRNTIKVLWQNTPFKFATGIYVLNWISFDIVALMLPFYILYWISNGDLLAKISIFGIRLSIESAVFGVMLLTATLIIPMWNWVAHKYSKRVAYITGMLFWIVVQIMIMFIQPGQMYFIMLLAFLAGIGVSTAHIMPDAIFPDVIDWDEFKTHTRREGMYYGAINFIRKMSSALAIFIALQVLGWVGYQSPPKNSDIFTQTPTTILTIRLMTGPVAVLLLASAIWFAWGYPLSRERQSRILQALQRRTKNQQNNKD